MYKDIFGKARQKVGLHIHTTDSDGRLSLCEVIKLYKDNGYDAVALTDHWKYHGFEDADGMSVISGAEYNIGGVSTEKGVYHILGLFTDAAPDVTPQDGPQTIIDRIHDKDGLAVLAHPAWSLNTPEMIMALRDIDATEIYNAVSEVEQSFRADSSLIVDMVASLGRDLPLLATDDAHYYGGADNCKAYIMVECESNDAEELKRAIKEKRFYATQGPEIHLLNDKDRFKVVCSPVEHIYFASNTAWCVRAFHGEGSTEAEYLPVDADIYVRAFAVDSEGRTAWSNIIML